MEQGSSSVEVTALREQQRILASQVAELQSVIVEQQATIREQQATIAAQHDALATAREQLTLLKKALYSPRRERFVPSPDQKLLFAALPFADESAATTSAATAPNAVSDATAAAATNSISPNGNSQAARKAHRKFVFPDFLPVVRHEHKLDDAECQCAACGQQRVIINTRVTKQIELEPAKAHIDEHVRYTYACPHCRDGASLQTTTKPPTPLEKSPFGASVHATVIANKFERHLPTYRQQEMFLAPLGLWLSRPLLCGMLRDSAAGLRLLEQTLLHEILAGHVVQVDETPIQYQRGEPGKSSTGYLFGYGGDASHRFLFYDFRPDRSRAGPNERLANFRGVLLTDGHSAYESVVNESQGRLQAAACWMHARREFDEARATTSHALVEETLARIGLLYDIEDRARALSISDRQALRSRESRPIVERLFARLDEVAATLRPTSQLALATQYALNRRVELSRFLDHGDLELDTGFLERSLRGPALGRKNYLFFGSLTGGHTAATLYSVVQSAKLYHLNVTAYLTDILRRLPPLTATDTAALRNLLPDRWSLAHPEHILHPRQQESRQALDQRRLRRTKRRLQNA